MRSSLRSGHNTLKLNSNSRGAKCHLEGGVVQENEFLSLAVIQVVDSLIGVRTTLARAPSIGPRHRSLITEVHAKKLYCCHQGPIIMVKPMSHVLPDVRCLQFQ